jgi:hypothetical protein
MIGKTRANQVEQQYMLQSISLAERMRQWDEFAEPYALRTRLSLKYVGRVDSAR